MGLKNQVKTVLLLGSMSALLLYVGNLVGGARGLTFALIITLIMNFGSFFFADKIVLSMYHAKEVPKNHMLYKYVDELRKIAKLPMPKVYIIPTLAPNAFATGRNPKHSAVAATEGIMHLLNEDELKGVLAHELTHIKNRDTLIATIAATIAGVISYVAMMARWAAIFGGYNNGQNRNENSGLEFLVLAILTPLLATIIQLAISRSREYLADEGGARISKKPKSLASALEKIENSVKINPLKATANTRATASLFISNPFKGGGILKLFSTHPPTKERVKKLNKMHY